VWVWVRMRTRIRAPLDRVDGRTRITTLSLDWFIVFRSSILAIFSVAFRLSSIRPCSHGLMLAGSEALPARPVADFGLGPPAARPEAGFGFGVPPARAAGDAGLGSVLGLGEVFSSCSSTASTELHPLGASTIRLARVSKFLGAVISSGAETFDLHILPFSTLSCRRKCHPGGRPLEVLTPGGGLLPGLQ
jgi:hypothetical protein